MEKYEPSEEEIKKAEDMAAPSASVLARLARSEYKEVPLKDDLARLSRIRERIFNMSDSELLENYRPINTIGARNQADRALTSLPRSAQDQIEGEFEKTKYANAVSVAKHELESADIMIQTETRREIRDEILKRMAAYKK